MRYEPTPALTLALERASAFAAAAGAARVEPRHLLLGLLAEDEGRSVALLVEAGIDWPKLQQHLGLNASRPESGAELPLSAEVRTVVSDAREFAALHSEDGSLSSDQVLLALLQSDERLRHELEEHSVNFLLLQQQIDPVLPPLTLGVALDLAEPVEATQTLRILDAAANRAREALRVLEDHTRFVLDDRSLTTRLKQLRHDLTDALRELPVAGLLEGRDTLNDVGTTISTSQEGMRLSLISVVQANAKRLQEALRSLEEFGKLKGSDFAAKIEQLRYQAYTLERALVQGASVRHRLADARLYVLVTEALCRASLVGTVKEALLGGAQLIQLREKTLGDRRLLALARDIRALTRAAGALFIVNDRPDIARLADADGVHLGQDDLSVHEARRIVGSDALIGVSTHDLAQLQRAVLEGASYLGVGPTFPTGTKAFDTFPGLDFVRQAALETSLPTFVLGGVTLDNIAEVVAAGGCRVAVSGAVCAAEDPRKTAGEFRRVLEG